MGMWTYIFLQGLWLLGAWEAYRAKWLTPRQMVGMGTPRGLPFLANIGMVNDLFTFHAGLALVIAACWSFWRSEPETLTTCIAAGAIGAYVLQNDPLVN